VFDHLTYSVLLSVRNSVYHWFDPGQYGVFVFFLVSGYIVPASLERKSSVRGFWVSRRGQRTRIHPTRTIRDRRFRLPTRLSRLSKTHRRDGRGQPGEQDRRMG
jgi:hypothetical protein